MRHHGGVIPRLSLLVSLAALGILFLSIAFAFVLVIGSFFGADPFTGEHGSPESLAAVVTLTA